MEARMARIEGLMETLMQECGLAGGTIRSSIEREEGDRVEGLQTQNNLGHPNEAANRRHSASAKRPFDSSREALARSIPERTEPPSLLAERPSRTSNEMVCTIQLGSRTLPFPRKAEYERYVDFFFTEVNPFHPCVNEPDFRSRSTATQFWRSSQVKNVCFLALNYIIFACSDAHLMHSADVSPPGWHWFQLADELIVKRKVSGRGGLHLVQILVYEVRWCLFIWKLSKTRCTLLYRKIVSELNWFVHTNTTRPHISPTSTSPTQPTTPFPSPPASAVNSDSIANPTGVRIAHPTQSTCANEYFGPSISWTEKLP